MTPEATAIAALMPAEGQLPAGINAGDRAAPLKAYMLPRLYWHGMLRGRA